MGRGAELMAARDIFAGKPDGWHFTASLGLWPEGDLTHQKYTYGDIVEHHGYRMESGAWCSQESEGETLPKSYRAKVKRFRDRRWRWLVLDSVVEIKDGWA